MIKGLHFLVIVFLFFGCATNNARKSLEKLKTEIKTANYEGARKVVLAKDFYADDNSKLLKLVEIGTVEYLNGNLYQALQAFDEAKELSDKLFTVSISKKLKSAFLNDSEDNYYGDLFERSYIRYYQALIHFKLSEKGEYESYEVVHMSEDGKEEISKKIIAAKTLDAKEKRFHLFAARSVLIEWNSLLSQMTQKGLGHVVFKDDLIAKLLGAFIHERIGTRDDRQIALGLYRSAVDLLFKNYNFFKTFNDKNELFKKDFDKLPSKELAEVEKNYVQKTNEYKKLSTLLASREKEVKSNKFANFAFVLEENFISDKYAKKIDFPLNLVTIPTTINDKNDFFSFVAKILHISVGANPKISFELPAIKGKVDSIEYYLEIENGKKEKIDLVAVDPLSEMAELALDNQIVATTARTGARVAGKHMAALVTAYLTYKSSAKSLGNELGYFAGAASYVAANKGIEYSERADLRSWSTLPSTIKFTSAFIPKGKYKIKLFQKAEKPILVKDYGEVLINKEGTLLTHRKL